MFSPLAWFFIIYFSVGILVTTEGLVMAWDSYPDYEPLIKIVASIVILILWPIIYFIKDPNDD